jgi:dTDP-4-dehydrorhamnose 3,5-epimerase
VIILPVNVVGLPDWPQGPVVLEPSKDEDAHGWVSSLFGDQTLESLGLLPISAIETLQSEAAGTVRGMACHKGPSLFFCVRGAARQVVIDLRPGSRTLLRHMSIDLTEVDGRAILVSPGFGHGWQSLTPRTAMVRMGAGEPGMLGGVRPDDPRISIKWPVSPILVTAKDRAWEPL